MVRFSYTFFKQRGARPSMLYNSPDIFNVPTHKPPCKYQCMEDPWGPGCDGHAALSNGDCEEVIDASGDRYIPAEKVVIRRPTLLHKQTTSFYLELS
jgi:hypothetical protein